MVTLKDFSPIMLVTLFFYFSCSTMQRWTSLTSSVQTASRRIYSSLCSNESLVYSSHFLSQSGGIITVAIPCAIMQTCPGTPCWLIGLSSCVAFPCLLTAVHGQEEILSRLNHAFSITHSFPVPSVMTTSTEIYSPDTQS